MPTDTLHLQPVWLQGSAARKGRYVLGPKLGEGGMGEVREAWDLVLKRTVALKILRAMDPVSLIRFMHEAQLQARVAHPNICRIYDVESTEGAPRIAMQLVDGGRTLADLAHQLTVAEILDIFIQVADAVQAAHRLRLIHRDLKPSNILLEPGPDGRWTAYVCDFGLAMALEEPALTTSHGVRGTPAYMAPEQLRGERKLIGPPTDVFALGGTLFFALYGRLPEGGCLDLPRLLGKRLAPPALPTCPKAPLSKDLETLLRTCLEPDPARRFASMTVLAEELRRLARGEPTQARPPTGSWRSLGRLRPGPRRGFQAAVALGCLGLGLGLLVLNRHLDRTRERRLAVTRRFALAASDLEHDLRMEKMLPSHDLRPGYARIRQRMGVIQAQMAALGADSEGPGRYALGRARLLMGDEAGARQELERAWACGNQGPEVAEALAEALVLAHAPDPGPMDPTKQAGPPASTAEAIPRRLEDLFRPGTGWTVAADDQARALVAFSQKDYAHAAAAARACFVDAPWRFEAATLEALSLQALGRQQALAGDAAGAENTFLQAKEAAQRYLVLAPSDPGLLHVYLIAGLAQASLARSRGALTFGQLAELTRHSQAALRLDPDRPELQDDWLRLSLLQAACLTDQGQDPQPALTSALAFLEARARLPLTPALKADQTLLQWGLASWPHARPKGLAFAGRPAPGWPDPFIPATIGY